MYEYKVNIIKVIDGDTVDVDIDLGFGMWIKDERVRIMGIDTPESITRDLVEKKFGLASKEKLKSLLGETAILKTQVNKQGEDMKGKFGRILGDFTVYDTETDSWKPTAQIMIDEGYAVEYTGGSKEEIQEQHMKNRERLIEEGLVKP